MTLALVGGDEFGPHCRQMDAALLEASGQRPARVAVVPTACAPYRPDLAAQHGVSYFASLGADAHAVMVLSAADASNPALIKVIEGAGVIYFSGGSPEHLLETLRGSAFWQAVLAAVEGGAVLAGSSAGAMVLGSRMRRPSGPGDWREALGVVPGLAVLPHHEKRDPADVSVQLLRHAPPGLTALGIDAQTACLGQPGKWRVIGHGKVTVYRGGQWRVFAAGEMLPPEV